MQCIDDYINGNLYDAKKRAQHIGRGTLIHALREGYGKSEPVAFAITAYLKGEGSFQAACDAEAKEKGGPQHDHDSTERCCPVCGLAPRLPRNSDTLAGFEVRTCTVCKEVKGGSPFRWCKCMRDREGLGDVQPHGA